MVKAESRGSLDGLASDGIEGFGHLLEGYQRLVAAVEADLKAETGMTLSELEVLIRLVNEPEHRLRPRDLANSCVMSTSGCTRLLDRLEQQQLIKRHPHGSDRRGLMVEVTKRGTRLLEAVLPDHHASLEKHFCSAVTTTELAQLSVIMRKIRDANT